MRTLVDGIWALMLPGIIIFGLKFGIFTPTEAAVVCAVYALFVAMFIYRELKWSASSTRCSSPPRRRPPW